MTAGQFPQAFIKREQVQLGAQWAQFEKAHEQQPPVSIRFNPLKIRQHQSTSPVPWTTHGAYLPERPSFTLDPSFHGGKYYVQEASSMFLEQAFRQLIHSHDSICVLDLCAAPGGKSTHLLSMMNDHSLLVSNEVIQSRVGTLCENVRKWGHSNIVVTNNDANDFQRLPGFFDVIVVDAPCSGEGLFRKDPAAVAEWSENTVTMCSKRQRRILSDIWPALKSGGILIYSTCTYNPVENEENLRWLKQQYALEPLTLNINADWQIQITQAGSIAGYRFFPHRVKGEGFFLAALRKLDDGEPEASRAKIKLHLAPGKLTELFRDWLLKFEEKSFILHNDQIHFFQKNRLPDLQAILNNLRVIFAGTTMASIKHDKLIPDHSFALSVDLNKNSFNTISLDTNTALQYLRKDVLPVHSEKKGFALITFDDVGLGWVNVLENRINNLYPSEWRIRIR